MADRSIVKSRMAPAAIGPYSQGILAGGTLYVSGQIALEPESGSFTASNIEEETEQVLKNIGAILQSAGLDFKNVVRCTVYMTDINAYAQINEVYSRYFSESPPARVAIQVAALPREASVEISCVAVE